MAPPAPPPKPSVAAQICEFVEVWWSAVFAAGCIALVFFVEPKQGFTFPPKLDLSGKQAILVMSNQWFLICAIPLVVGVFFLQRTFKKYSLFANQPVRAERGMMVWWLMNLCFFHTACDVLSGYYQVMPILTDHYKEMSPAHLEPRWADARQHFDLVYVLEGLVEAPLALIMLVLHLRRHPARHIVEVFAVAVQLAGTVCYYCPRFFKGEQATTWLYYCDCTCGAAWIVFPLLVLWRHISTAARAADKKS